MKNFDSVQYDRIAQAIQFIEDSHQNQPSLEEIAAHINLSPFHFQRLFKDWAGTTPKNFLQYTSLSNAKKLLKKEDITLFDTAFESGLSSTSRLHDLFIKIEGMTPGEYKNGGQNLTIDYSFYDSPFGKILIANTPKGICHIAFEDDLDKALEDLQNKYPKANYRQNKTDQHSKALQFFQGNWSDLKQVKIHLKGTPFQIKVWESLLQIPAGQLSTYGQIAEKINQPNASRAVGTAIGSNPIAYLIPCHRVIQATGHFGNYRWDKTRKKAMIGWEFAQNQE